MNTASKDLCDELFGLSKWETEDWFKGQAGVKIIPKYDLGYLLRELPVWTSSKEHGPLEIIPYVNSYWEMKYSHKTKKHTLLGKGKTPEDAACSLAISLFKQGILK